MQRRDPQPAIPGPRGIPLLGKTGAMLRFFSDPIRCLRDLHTRYGAVGAVCAGDPSLVCGFGPDINRQVLSSPDLFRNAAELPVRIPQGSSLHRLTTFLVGMNGDEHRRLRRALTALFHKQHHEHHHATIVATADAALARWRPGETIDMSTATAELALRIGFRSMFDLDVVDEAAALAKMARGFTSSATSLPVMLAPLAVPGLPYWRFLRACERQEQHLTALIAARRGDAAGRHDALSVLMTVTDDAGATLPDSLLIGLANELFIASHETTASTLAWTLFLLERHPAVLADLLDELAPLGGGAPTLEQLDAVPILDAVVKESMRVLPATPFLFFRRNHEPVRIGGYDLPAGSSLVISPLMTHHMPELYPLPRRFDPARWRTADPSPYEYLPFGAGARSCLGVPFATMSLRLVLAMIVQRFRLELPRGAEVSYKTRGIILGTKDGMPMRLTRQDHRRRRPEPVRGNLHELVDLPPA